jgi:hypothetical protein
MRKPTTTSPPTPSTATAAPRNRRRGRQPGPTGPTLHGGSREARRLTAVILDVLAGQRTPADAATAVGVSVPRYYALESRALHGLLAACEPRAPGRRRRSPEREVEELKKQVQRLERECARSQALLRLSQRAIGVVGASSKAKRGARKKRQRRPVVRALKAADKLRAETTPLPEEPIDANNS